MRLKFFLFLTISIFLFSCKSKKTIVQEPFVLQSDSIVQVSLDEHNLDFEWFVAKSKTRIKSEVENVKTSNFIRIRRDSVIWMVFKKLGVEAIRFQMTPDSLAMINRIDKNFIKGSLKDVSFRYGIDINFGMIQELIVGNILSNDEDPFRIDMKNESYHCNSENSRYTIEHVVDGRSLNVVKSNYIDDLNRVFEVFYDDYEALENNVDYSLSRTYLFPESEMGKLELHFDFSSVQIDVPKSVKFSIPSHYEELR